MLDHAQIEAPQFQEGESHLPSDFRAPRADYRDEARPLHSSACSQFLGMMFLPLQIALAMPQVAMAESKNSALLRHLEWQRSRERSQR